METSSKSIQRYCLFQGTIKILTFLQQDMKRTKIFCVFVKNCLGCAYDCNRRGERYSVFSEFYFALVLLSCDIVRTLSENAGNCKRSVKETLGDLIDESGFAVNVLHQLQK